MRWRPWLLLLLLALAAPVASQGLVRTVVVDRTEPLDLVATTRVVAPPEVNVGGCYGGAFTVLENGFRFSENSRESGCGTATMVLDVPPGAREMVISFEATREVTGDGIDEVNVTAEHEQNLVVESWGRSPQEVFIIPPFQGPRPSLQLFSFLFPVEPGRPANVTWVFADRGGPVAVNGNRLPSAQNFAGLIQNGSVTWRGAAASVWDIAVVDESRRGGMIYETHRLRTTLEVPAGGRLQRAEIVVVDSLSPRAASGPAGAISLEDLPLRIVGDELRIEVPAGVLAQQGSGTYSFFFESARVAPAVPEPAPPARYPWLFWLLFGLPFAAAIGSGGSTARLLRGAQGRYRRTAWGLAAILIGLTLYHLGTFLYALGLPRSPFIVLPVTGLPAVLYLQAVILFIIIATLGWWGGQATWKAMRRDMQERAERERELKRSNEDLERFAYVASHDLQEPLRKISGATQMLQRRYGDRFGPDADKWINYSVDGAKRMQELVQGLLALSRVDRGELEAVRIDTDAAVADVLGDLEPRIQEAKAKVQVAGLPPVLGDPLQVRQVFQNLIGNAIKYRAAGHAPRIVVRAQDAGPRVEFRIEDDGIGIPEDKRDEVFQVFRRLHARSEYEGTGLGLSLVRKIVERHGGTIHIESNRPRGSVFVFDLERA